MKKLTFVLALILFSGIAIGQTLSCGQIKIYKDGGNLKIVKDSVTQSDAVNVLLQGIKAKANNTISNEYGKPIYFITYDEVLKQYSLLDSGKKLLITSTNIKTIRETLKPLLKNLL